VELVKKQPKHFSIGESFSFKLFLSRVFLKVLWCDVQLQVLHLQARTGCSHVVQLVLVVCLGLSPRSGLA
jgi:hypothetical protein